MSNAVQFLMLAILAVFAVGVIIVIVSTVVEICKVITGDGRLDFSSLVAKNWVLGKKLIYIWILEFVLGVVYIGIAYLSAILKK